MEAYGRTRKMTDGKFNEDAFLIIREPNFIVALADGSGNAGGVARKAIQMFERLVRYLDSEDLKVYATWEGIMKNLDAYLSGGPQTTLIAAAMIGEGVYGACVGDSRCYLYRASDLYPNSVANDTRPRLGSGECKISPLHARLQDDEFLIFASDGAWTQMDRLDIQYAKRRCMHFSDLPEILIEKLNRHGCADDMTVIAVRR